MLRASLTIACAAGAVLALMAPAPVAAQQEITLTVAAGQPLRAMNPLNLVSTFFIPEVNKRIEAAGLDNQDQLEGSLCGVASEADLRAARRPATGSPTSASSRRSSIPTSCRSNRSLHDAVHDHRRGAGRQARSTSCTRRSRNIGRSTTSSASIRLGGASFDSYELFTTFPVQKFEDIKGKKHRTAGAALQWLRGTAATPVQSNMTLYYNDAKTGVVDGFIIFPSAIPGMKYPEAAPYVTKVGFGAQYAAALIINKSVYDKLPPELQKILHEAAQAWTAAADSGAARSSTTRPMVPCRKIPRRAKLRAAARGAGEVGERHAEHRQGMGGAIDKQGLPGTEVLAAYMEEMRKAGAKPVRNWDQK